MKTLYRIAEIEKRADAATEGPWGRLTDSKTVIAKYIVAHCGAPYPGCFVDSKFIASARTDVPWLCQSLRTAVEALGQIVDYQRTNRCEDTAEGHMARKALEKINGHACDAMEGE
jgi:hypothetical protein